jgi:hypothetical protein
MLIGHLQSLTNLTYAFAGQCLMESNWDMKTAIEMFKASKANIPPEGWLEGGVSNSSV